MSERLTILARCDLGDELADVLASWRADGIDVRLVPERRDEAAFLAALPDADILLHVLNPVTAAAIAAAPRLKLIQKVGVGVNTIDLDAARAAGVAVCNMPGTNTGAVAEFTIALMLAALRRVPAFVGEARRTAGWLQPPGREGSLGEIGGRVVGLIGAGAVASRVAAICAAMGAEVIYWSRSQRPDMAARFRDFDDLMAEADIVSLHVPLTAETEKLLNRGALARIRPGAILVNTARGGLVDESALLDALNSGRLAVAALDVLAVEPPDDRHPLLAHERVLVTPHIAWLTRETWQRSLDVMRQNALRLRAGEPLLHRVI